MVQVFQGEQFVTIVFKCGETYRVTKRIKDEGYYIQTLVGFIKKYNLEVGDTYSLAYEMVRDQKKNKLTVNAVVLVEVKSQPKIDANLWSIDPVQLEKYTKKVIPNLTPINIFAEQGSEVQLLK